MKTYYAIVIFRKATEKIPQEHQQIGSAETFEAALSQVRLMRDIDPAYQGYRITKITEQILDESI